MKNLRAIILLFLANTVSGIAQGISLLAVPWYFAKAYDMEKFALVYILTNVVSLIWVPSAGVLVDRHSRKNIFLWIQIIGGSLLTLVAALGHHAGFLPWYLVSVGFVLTFFNFNIHYPNLYAFAQEITETKFYGRITSALEIQGQLTTMMAGAAATLLLEGTIDGQLNIFGFKVVVPFEVQAWEIYEIFTLDAATYFLAFLIVALIGYTPLVERPSEIGGMMRRLQTGYAYLMKNKSILIFAIGAFSVFVIVIVEGFYLGPLYVNNHLEALGDVYAASEMYYALGALSAGALILKVLNRKPKAWGIIALTILMTAICTTFFLTRSTYVFYAGLLGFGICNAGTRVLRITYLLKKVPNEVFGRANSIFVVINIALRILFVSLFAMPFFLSGSNVIYTFAIAAVFLALSAVLLIRYYPSFNDY